MAKKFFLIIEELTAKYLERAFYYKDLVTSKISEDNVRETIKCLNKIKVLKKVCSRTNTIDQSLINKSIFTETKLNSSIIALLAYIRHEKSLEIIKYIFKDSVEKTQNQLIYRYTKGIDRRLVDILNFTKRKKYNLLLECISENKINAIKIKLDFEIEKINYELVPLEIFTRLDNFYLCAYDYFEKKIKIFDIDKISSFSNMSDVLFHYILEEEIDDAIKDFINASVNTDPNCEFFMKISPSLINTLLSMNLIETDFEIYDYKEIDYGSSKKKTKINQDHTMNKMIMVDNFVKTILLKQSDFRFDHDYKDNYIFRVKTNQVKKDIINRLFRENIEILSSNKYKIKIIND